MSESGYRPTIGVRRLSRSVLLRDRVVRSLSRVLADEVTVVRAPVGFGKATAVASWTLSAEAPRTAWLDLQYEAVTDAPWRGIAAALGAGGSPSGAALGDDGLFELVRDRVAAESDPFVLVLAGYAEAEGSSAADDLVRLIRTTPNLHLIVLTRTVTAFESMRLSAGVDVGVIDETDLAFTADETVQLASASGLTADTFPVVHVQRMSCGWPLLVRALVNRVVQTGASTGVGQVDHAVGELVDDLLAPLGDAERVGLARMASVRNLTPELLAHAFPAVDSELILQAVARHGLGTYPREGGAVVMRLLEPVRRHLAHRYDDATDGEGVEVTREFVEALGRTGEAATALQLSLDAGDLDLAEELVARHLAAIYTSRSDAYLQAFDEVGERDLHGSPLLLVVAGLLRETHGQHPQAQRLFATASEAATARRADQDRFEHDLVSMIALRKTGQFSQAEQFRLRIEPELERRGTDDPFSGIAIVESAITALRSGRGDHLGWANAVRPIDPALAFAFAGVRALQGALRGEVRSAEAECAEADARLDLSLLADSPLATPYVIARHLIATETRDRTAAEHPLDDSGEFAHTAGYARALRSIQEGRLLMAHVELDAQLGAETRLLASNREDARIVALRADLHIAEGNLVRAHQLLKGFPDGTDALLPVRARLALMQQTPRIAHMLAERVIAEADGPRSKVEALLVNASAQKKLGMRRAAGASFLFAVELSEESAVVTPFALAIAEDIAEFRTELRPEQVATTEGTPLFSVATMAAKLTKRERVVLERLDSDASLEEIARILVVSVNTVKSQTRSLYRKLGVSSRLDAVNAARDLGIIRVAGPRGADLNHGDRIA
jgi:LuxR family maltose regulon positive regulatory protein